MKALIIGIDSFLGRHLHNRLLEKGYEVHGTFRNRGKLKLNILNYKKLCDIVQTINPNYIFHLAAQSSPPESWIDPEQTIRTNVIGSLNVLEAVRNYAIEARVLMVGSSASYGNQNNKQNINEKDRTYPNSPYGVSKLAQDHLSLLYNQKYNLQIICARPFFLIGPGKTGDVCSDFARGIVNIERKISDKLLVGNLNIVRDFLDFRDGVAAMEIIIKRGKVGEIYNISGGKGYNLKKIINKMENIIGFKVKVQEMLDLVRRLDNNKVIGDNAKLSELGWKKKYTIDQTLSHIIHHWRKEEILP